ncbi:MAG: sigma-E factor negative regulatory protein [Burkholderiaceae bacterium]
MTEMDDLATSTRERLSAMVDGETDDAAVRLACGEWRIQSAIAATWRDYQLIGDVLRSEDLATTAAHDANFLQSLRDRLDGEPTVLMPAAPAPGDPAPARTPYQARRSWVAASAVAAGFMAVAGVLVVVRGPDAPSGGAGFAQERAGSGVVLASDQTTMGPPADVVPGLVRDANLIRDARLDQYLKAHKQFAGTSALSAPTAFVRSAASDAPRR